MNKRISSIIRYFKRNSKTDDSLEIIIYLLNDLIEIAKDKSVYNLVFNGTTWDRMRVIKE